VQRLGDKARSPRAAPMRAHHVGFGPGLVDEDEARGVKPSLITLPPGSSPCDVGTILLAGVQAFF
jgi:hypothetical protein